LLLLSLTYKPKQTTYAPSAAVKQWDLQMYVSHIGRLGKNMILAEALHIIIYVNASSRFGSVNPFLVFEI